LRDEGGWPRNIQLSVWHSAFFLFSFLDFLFIIIAQRHANAHTYEYGYLMLQKEGRKEGKGWQMAWKKKARDVFG
jgi:hypothetical protein